MENDLNRNQGIAKVGGLIKDIRIAMLTTADTDGRLHSRPMATQETNFDGTLWFLTRQHSGKVDEIRHDAEVNLTYADQKHSFVTISGRASVSKDRAKIDELWNASYKAWFPQGKDDPEITVIRVTADEAEYWEASSNAIVRNVKILQAAVTGDSSKVGQHGKVELAARKAS